MREHAAGCQKAHTRPTRQYLPDSPKSPGLVPRLWSMLPIRQIMWGQRKDDAEVKDCPNCGAVVETEAEYCPCGFQFPDDGSSFSGPKAARKVSARERRKAGRDRQVPKKAGRSNAKFESEVSDVLDQLEVATPATRSSSRSKAGASRPSKPQLMSCPACKAEISRRAGTCPKCGADPFAKCGICRSRIPTGSLACPECGDPDPFNP